MNDIMRHSC